MGLRQHFPTVCPKYYLVSRLRQIGWFIVCMNCDSKILQALEFKHLCLAFINEVNQRNNQQNQIKANKLAISHGVRESFLLKATRITTETLAVARAVLSADINALN